MPFPNSPTNGQLATVNNIVYTYNSAKGVWNKANVSAPLQTQTISITGNITTSANLSVAGQASITGNVGLGIDTPVYKLDVRNGTASFIGISGSAAVRIAGAGGSWFWIDNPTTTTMRFSSGAIPGTGSLVLNSSGNLVIDSTTTSSSTTTGALVVNGGAGVKGNLFVGNTLTIQSNIALPSLAINGTATKGGAGFHDFLSVTNQGGGTNPTKWFRTNSTGGFEIINNAYTTAIFVLSDSGELNLSGNLTTASRGISRASVPAGSILQVQQTAMPTTLYSSSGNTGVLDVTNWSTTFTPYYNTSRVFHIITIGLKFICDGRVYIKRGGSVVSPSLADQWREMSWDATVDMGISTLQWLDSPATASQITYQLAVQATGCSSVIAVGSSADFTPYWTIMEIAV